MMNPLKEHAHLFGNGKFKVQAGKQAKFVTIFQPYINETSGNYYHNGFKMDECTLIARPIADMKNEELGHFMIDKYHSWDEIEQFVSDMAGVDTLDFEDARYLLSIGVYPFDQSHFDDGTVIDSREV